MTGRVVVQFRGVDGTLRRFIFDPVDAGHMWIEYRKCAGEWIPVGREPVEDVDLKTSTGGTTSQRGP